MRLFGRTLVVGAKDEPDTSRICDFPEATRVSREIDRHDRHWYLIEGHPGIYEKTSDYFGKIRARRGQEILWFCRDMESERGITEMAEIIAKSIAKEAVA